MTQNKHRICHASPHLRHFFSSLSFGWILAGFRPSASPTIYVSHCYRIHSSDRPESGGGNLGDILIPQTQAVVPNDPNPTRAQTSPYILFDHRHDKWLDWPNNVLRGNLPATSYLYIYVTLIRNPGVHDIFIVIFAMFGQLFYTRVPCDRLIGTYI